MVDVAVGVTATYLFCINFRVDAHRQGWMLLLCAARVCDQVFRKHGFGYVGMLLGVWGSTWPARNVVLCVVVVVLLACT